jgi:hypothetical protein
MKPTVISCRCTSVACPVEYEGKLDNGKMFLLIFRKGRLLITESISNTNNILDAKNGVDIYWYDYQEEWDGFMTENEIRKQLAHVYNGVNSLTLNTTDYEKEKMY